MPDTESWHHNYAFGGSLLSTYCVPSTRDLTGPQHQGSNCEPQQGVKNYEWVRQKSSTFPLRLLSIPCLFLKIPPRN